MRLGMLDGERSFVVPLNSRARRGALVPRHQGRAQARLPAGGRAGGVDATSRFHNSAHAAAWSDPAIDAAYERVRTLVLRGLAA